MASVFHNKRGRRRQQRLWCDMAQRSSPPYLMGSYLFLLYLASHHLQSQAFLLINYQSTPVQSNGGQTNNNLGGLLPNGYNLAASNSMPANQQQLPSQQAATTSLNQQQQQDNQQQYPSGNLQPDTYGSDLANGGQSQGGGGGGMQPQPSLQPSTPVHYSPQSVGSSRASRERDLPSENPYAPGLDRDPIFRFHGNALNSTAAKLVWSLRSGAVADQFELRYGPIPDNIDAYSVKLNGSARDYTVAPLQPGEMYEFRLQGYYGGGDSSGRAGNTWRPRVQLVQIPPLNEDFSQQQALMKQSLLDNREVMPLGVKAEAKSNQSIQLNWTEQERPVNLQKSKRVNVIRYYFVSGPNTTAGQQDSAGSATQANSTAPPSPPPRYHYLNITADSARGEIRENRVVIQKLRPATEFAFAVRTSYYSPDLKKLFTSSGFSMDTLAKTHDLEPSAVRNFTVTPLPLSQAEQVAGVESGKPVMPTVELTWAPPESPNGPIRAYWILFANDLATPDDKWSLIQINDTTSNFWQVGNLKPGLSYYFKMRALNQRGPGPDSQTRVFTTPPAQRLLGAAGGGAPSGTLAGGVGAGPPPIPANNILMLIVICLVAILFVLFLVVSRLFCRTRSSAKRANRKQAGGNSSHLQGGDFSTGVPKLNGFGPSGNSSTVTARMGTLARRARPMDNANKQQAGGNPDYWISAMEQQQAIAAQAAAAADVKSQMSEKSNSDINMAAMVSIQRDSPQQFTTQTTQLAPMLTGPEYRFAAAAAAAAAAEQQQQMIMQQMQHQQQSHYHTGHHALGGYDQMDGATASALMTLSKRQQQQLLKYGQMQPFGGAGGQTGGGGVQAPSPHQQPPPPPPLNIEQQQQQQQQQQSLYGTHGGGGGHLNSTRSLRIHRPPLSYDPVSGSFVQQNQQQQQQQQETSPPNYNSHLNSMLNGVHHQLASYNQNTPTSGSNTLQFHPSHNHNHHHHQTGTLTARRSTNTLRSFGGAGGGGGVYGQLGSFAVAPPVAGNQQQQQQQPGGLLQNHQAVINQLNQPAALPLKHVSAVRPQIMSSLEDQIEMELAEKQAEQQQQQQRQGPPVSMQQQADQQHSQQQQT